MSEEQAEYKTKSSLYDYVIIHKGYSVNNIKRDDSDLVRFTVQKPNGERFEALIQGSQTIVEYIDELIKEKNNNKFTSSYRPPTEEDLYAEEYKQENYYQYRIAEACDDIKTLLLTKNAAYGDSAFNEVSIFGNTIPAKDAVLCRLADKVKRMETVGMNDGVEQTLDDLIGYAIILKILLEEEADDEIDF